MVQIYRIQNRNLYRREGISCAKNRIVTKGKNHKLEVTIPKYEAHSLLAPAQGTMARIIKSCAELVLNFRKALESFLIYGANQTGCEFVNI